MISLKVNGKTLEVIQGSHIYFGSEDGIGFFQKWDEIEAQEIKNTFQRLEQMAKVVMEKLAEAADALKSHKQEEVTIN